MLHILVNYVLFTFYNVHLILSTCRDKLGCFPHCLFTCSCMRNTFSVAMRSVDKERRKSMYFAIIIGSNPFDVKRLSCLQKRLSRGRRVYSALHRHRKVPHERFIVTIDLSAFAEYP